jgi:hypothetical protein
MTKESFVWKLGEKTKNLKVEKTNKKIETWEQKSFFERHTTKERALRSISELESKRD